MLAVQNPHTRYCAVVGELRCEAVNGQGMHRPRGHERRLRFPRSENYCNDYRYGIELNGDRQTADYRGDSGSRAGTAAPTQLDAQRLDPSTYKQIRTPYYAAFLKDPDAHVGEKFILYGQVAQFDTATGKPMFRADTVAIPHDVRLGYPQMESLKPATQGTNE